jgi:cytochrome c553
MKLNIALSLFSLFAISMNSGCSGKSSPEETLYEQLQDSQKRIERLKQENKNLNVRIKERDERYQNQVVELTTQIEKLENKIQDNKKKINQKDEKISVNDQILKAEIDGLKREKLKLQQKLDELNKDLAKKDKYIQEDLKVKRGKNLYNKCIACHGSNGEKSALGQTKPIYNWSKESIKKALIGYQNLTYGTKQNNEMRKAVLNLTEYEIDAISEYVSTFKKPDLILLDKTSSKNKNIKNHKYSENPIKSFLSSELEVETVSDNKKKKMSDIDKTDADYLAEMEQAYLEVNTDNYSQESVNKTHEDFDSSVANNSPQEVLELTTIQEKKTSNLKTSLNETQIGARLFSKCVPCHGSRGEKKALGKSKIIGGWSFDRVVNALNGYINGSYNSHSPMSGIMRGQVASLSKKDVVNLAKYISSLKTR